MSEQLSKMQASYTSGPYKVYADDDYARVMDTDTGKKVVFFRGETAWSDAERWVDDNYNPHLNGPSILKRLA